MIYLGLKRFLNNYHNSPTLNFTPENLIFFSPLTYGKLVYNTLQLNILRINLHRVKNYFGALYCQNLNK